MSGSLLLILTVGLLLLAPLLLRNQSPVRRTSRALLETRVVHEGGTALPKRRRRPRPAPAVYAEDEEELEFVEAEPEFVIVDDVRGSRTAGSAPVLGAATATGAAATGDVNGPAGGTAGAEAGDASGARGVGAVPASRAGNQSGASVGSDPADAPEVVDGEVLAEYDGDVPGDDGLVPTDGGHADVRSGDQVGVAAHPTLAGSAANHGARAAAERGDASASTDPAASDPSGADAAEASPNPASENDDAPHRLSAVGQSERHPSRPVDPAYLRGVDLLGESEPDGPGASVATAASAVLAVPDEAPDTASQEDIAYAARRRGRGVYDPVASQALAMRRLRRRKQVLSAMLGLTAVALVAGVIAGGWAWLALAGMVALTGVYLFYLRKQTVEEAKLRARRLARMRRARLGVRNTEDLELGVPDRLLRPGAVILETDDVDPAFMHLPVIDGAEYFGDAGDPPWEATAGSVSAEGGYGSGYVAGSTTGAAAAAARPVRSVS